MTRVFLAIVCGAALCVTGGLPALAGTLTAELNRTAGSTEDDYTLTLTIEGSPEGQLRVPEINGLRLRAQGQSQQDIEINGQRQISHVITFAVEVSGPGDYVIPSFRMRLDGEEVASLPLKLAVSGRSSGGAGAGQTPPATAGGGPPTPPAGKRDDVMIEAECPNLTPYVGEQVICTIRLWQRINLRNIQRVANSNAEFRRFLGDGERREERSHGGQNYLVREFPEVVVPQATGELTLPAFTIKASALVTRRRDLPLGGFFGGAFNFQTTEEEPVEITGPELRFNVRPLPTAGQPPGGVDVVGKFTLTADAVPKQVAVGDTVTITMKLSGSGLLDTLTRKFQTPDTVRAYEDKPEYRETVDGTAGLQSEKIFRVALVPSRPGRLALGEQVIHAFNPSTGKYERLTADPGEIEVTGQAQPLAQAAPGPTAGRSDGSNADGNEAAAAATKTPDRGGPPADRERPVMRAVSGRHDLSPAQKGLILMAALAFAGAGGGVAFREVRRRRQRGSPDAARQLAKSIMTAKSALDSRPDVALAEITRAFRGWLGPLIGAEGKALTGGDLAMDSARVARLPDGFAEKAAGLLRELDEEACQPGAPVPQRVRGLIERIDDCMRGVAK